MRVAIYARVSTTDQTCDLQLQGARGEYITARGWSPTGEYVDTGWSGSAASRPEFDRLLNDARMRRIDAVLVWKLDRWGRSVAASVKSIQELVSLGVASSPSLRTSTPTTTTRWLGSSSTFSPHSRSLSGNRFGSESRLEYVPPKHEESKSEGPSESSAVTRQCGSERRERVGER